MIQRRRRLSDIPCNHPHTSTPREPENRALADRFSNDTAAGDSLHRERKDHADTEPRNHVPGNRFSKSEVGIVCRSQLALSPALIASQSVNCWHMRLLLTLHHANGSCTFFDEGAIRGLDYKAQRKSDYGRQSDALGELYFSSPAE
jgi:hypothetical protein